MYLGLPFDDIPCLIILSLPHFSHFAGRNLSLSKLLISDGSTPERNACKYVFNSFNSDLLQLFKISLMHFIFLP